MAVLQYKTRGMSNPRGKPKVYFCAHPEDHSRYFAQISDELLRKQDCSVWYCLDAEFDAQFFEDLKTMQLIVVPVTPKLLCRANWALDVGFPFAIENHIPVLPLMQEGGLEELFNCKCGDLQFLDKNNTDGTAISYDEKLSRFLSSVLIGDELAEKIRAAFDAYVFLSYRKKDRKYAQELMRLIHQNDFCRDIAIWYDEFLTPGENFNDSIREALEKSGLFVMAVTPNLVNETNYIMTAEFPMAQKAGKPILPAELVPTDRDLLARQFPGIPECTDAHQGALLSDVLREQIKKLAIRKNDSSPEHNFFIGLAYLSGVDVEVDHERAVGLITSAAESGLIEAIDKLIEMYRTGMGVERSYDTAAVWLEKKLKLYQERYHADPCEDNLYYLWLSAEECGSHYGVQGKISLAKEKYNCGLACVENAAQEGSERIKEAVVHGYIGLGDVCEKAGDVLETQSCYEKALSAFTMIENTPGTRDYNNSMRAVIYNRLGNNCVANGDLSGARKHYERMYALNLSLVEQRGTVDDRYGLSIAYDNLGHISAKEHDWICAKAYYQKSLAIRQALVEETASPEYRRGLYASYANVAKECGIDNPDETRYYQKCVEICEALVRDVGTAESMADLANSYFHLAFSIRDRRKIKWCQKRKQRSLGVKRMKYFKKALDIFQTLCEECPGVVEYQKGLEAAKSNVDAEILKTYL